jgi:hypothetical protein
MSCDNERFRTVETVSNAGGDPDHSRTTKSGFGLPSSGHCVNGDPEAPAPAGGEDKPVARLAITYTVGGRERGEPQARQGIPRGAGRR